VKIPVKRKSIEANTLPLSALNNAPHQGGIKSNSFKPIQSMQELVIPHQQLKANKNDCLNKKWGEIVD